MKKTLWIPMMAAALSLAVCGGAFAEEYRGFDDYNGGDWGYQGYDDYYAGYAEGYQGYDDAGYNAGYDAGYYDDGTYNNYDDTGYYDYSGYQDVSAYGSSDYRGFDDVGANQSASGYGYDDYLIGESYSSSDSSSYSGGSLAGSGSYSSSGSSYSGGSLAGSGSYSGSSSANSGSSADSSQTGSSGQTGTASAAGTNGTAGDTAVKTDGTVTKTTDASKPGETTAVKTAAAGAAADPADTATCRFTTDSMGQMEIHYCEKHAPLIEREERQAGDGLTVEELKSLINSWESALNELYIKWQSPLSVEDAGKVRNARIAFYTQLDQQDIVLAPYGEEEALRFRLQALKEECARLCLQLRNRG